MFSLSKKTDYGLMALGFLSHVGDRPVNSREIAERYNIPAELLAKIMQTLAREGLVLSFSGPKGGYQLARRPEEITVADVIRA
ncbi:MAG: RrF2 family transcriptional regulator, partial [Nitrospinota bacterium]